MHKTKILITGGHVTPAIAVIEKLQGKWNVIYVGRKYPMEGDLAVSTEYRWITDLGIPFRILQSGRIQRRITVYTLLSLLKIPIGFIQSILLVLREKPAVILSFGGYIAAPVAVAGWMFKIPVVTHEQTMRPGVSSKFIGKLAKKICISWNGTQHYFNKRKIILTGNPIRTDVTTIRKKISFSQKLPLIYITGGSLGSQAINSVVEGILEKLLQSYTVLHQCGSAKNAKDYKRLMHKKQHLPKALQDRYRVQEHFDAEHIGWIMKNADLLISRAGANTISEIIALGKVSILIPLPWSGAGEQYIQAQFIEEAGAGLMIDQDKLTEAHLLKTITRAFATKSAMTKCLTELSVVDAKSAASKIVAVIEDVRNKNASAQ